jgi:hypothetical protein
MPKTQAERLLNRCFSGPKSRATQAGALLSSFTPIKYVHKAPSLLKPSPETISELSSVLAARELARRRNKIMNVYSAVCNVDVLIRYGPLNCVYLPACACFFYYCVPVEASDAPLAFLCTEFAYFPLQNFVLNKSYMQLSKIQFNKFKRHKD